MGSFNTLINGGYQHTTEDIVTKAAKEDEDGNIIRDNLGNPIDSGEEVTKTIYRDVHLPAQCGRIKALHPFPAPPFPMHLPHAQAMANTFLRKRLEPMEESWVEKRLQRAAEFAAVPETWDIEPKKPDANSDNDDQASDEESAAEDAERMPLKRVKGSLGEEDIVEMWRTAHQEYFDREYLKATYPSMYGGDDGGSPEDEEDEDEEEDEFEDVMDTSGAPTAVPTAALAASQSQGTVLAVSSITPAVHLPTPGAPMLPLGFLHKFMVTGEATGK